MALYIPHSIFHLAWLLYVRPETFGPYYVASSEMKRILGGYNLYIIVYIEVLLSPAQYRKECLDYLLWIIINLLNPTGHVMHQPV